MTFSLRTKLTIALLVTSLAAASVVGLVAQWELSRKFSRDIMVRSFDAFKGDVAAYVGTYGSWENADATEPFGQFVSRRSPERLSPSEPGRGSSKRNGSS